MPVYWKDGDVQFIDGDVRFVPHNIGLIPSEPSHELTSSIPVFSAGNAVVVSNTRHGLISDIAVFPIEGALIVVTPCHEVISYSHTLSIGGGLHDNTEHIIYNAHDYLRCRHQGGNLVGTYTSPVFDLGSAGRYLAYIVGQDTSEADIVVVGFGTTWDAQVPVPTTWENINVSTYTWTNIFALDQGPSVEMRLYYGQTSPPTNYLDKMEILSGIVTDARYFRVRITITDPAPEIYAYVEKFYLRLCQ
ncbi:MAG: hypothetical protein ACYSSO_11690 [Planctomycetota bacterium]